MNLLTLSFLLQAGTAVLASALFTDDATHQNNMWENYKKEHGRVFDSESEEAERFGHFLASLKEIDAFNKKSAASGHPDAAVYGLTPLSDMNATSVFSTAMPEPPASQEHGRKLPSCSPSASLKDWSTGANVITSAVKSQGWCGANWAFAVTEQVESDALRRGPSYNYVLAPQQLIHCVTNNNGCQTVTSLGASEYAFDYLKTTGLYLNNNYPYSSSNGITGGPCRATSSSTDQKVRVGGFFSVLTGSESCMANHVQTTGTLAVCLTTGSNVMNYVGGIMSAAGCAQGMNIIGWVDPTQYTYCGQIVGVNPAAGTTPYWKFRGSFGVSWGEAGFIRIEYGTNACHVNQNPIYTTVKVPGEF